MKTTHVVERNEVPTPSSSLECEACYRYTKTAYNLERFLGWLFLVELATFRFYHSTTIRIG